MILIQQRYLDEADIVFKQLNVMFGFCSEEVINKETVRKISEMQAYIKRNFNTIVFLSNIKTAPGYCVTVFAENSEEDKALIELIKLCKTPPEAFDFSNYYKKTLAKT